MDPPPGPTPRRMPSAALTAHRPAVPGAGIGLPPSGPNRRSPALPGPRPSATRSTSTPWGRTAAAAESGSTGVGYVERPRSAGRPVRGPVPAPPDRLSFPPGVGAKLGAYVYLLVDPRSGRPFFVGRGRGDRCHRHIQAGGDGSPFGCRPVQVPAARPDPRGRGRRSTRAGRDSAPRPDTGRGRPRRGGRRRRAGSRTPHPAGYPASSGRRGGGRTGQAGQVQARPPGGAAEGRAPTGRPRTTRRCATAGVSVDAGSTPPRSARPGGRSSSPGTWSTPSTVSTRGSPRRPSAGGAGSGGTLSFAGAPDPGLDDRYARRSVADYLGAGSPSAVTYVWCGPHWINTARADGRVVQVRSMPGTVPGLCRAPRASPIEPLRRFR